MAAVAAVTAASPVAAGGADVTRSGPSARTAHRRPSPTARRRCESREAAVEVVEVEVVELETGEEIVVVEEVG